MAAKPMLSTFLGWGRGAQVERARALQSINDGPGPCSTTAQQDEHHSLPALEHLHNCPEVQRFHSLDEARAAIGCESTEDDDAAFASTSPSYAPPHVSNLQKRCIFAAGLPASGKSFALYELFEKCVSRDEIAVLDLDREIRAHPAYDENNPTAVYDAEGAYEWANARMQQKYEKLLSSNVPQIIIDGTGTKPARRVRRMESAREHGFHVLLLYVSVSLHIALERNSLRQRRVPLEQMLYYKKLLDESVLQQAPHADKAIVLENDAAATPSVRTSSAARYHNDTSSDGEQPAWLASTNDYY